MDSKIKLLAVGDIDLVTKNDLPPFEGVKEIFHKKDILFGNLETTLSLQGEKAQKRTHLYISPDKVSYLKEAGFDVLNVANNHIMDLGIPGFNETMEVLHKNQLFPIGAVNKVFNYPYALIERKGITFCFLAYNFKGFKNEKEGVFINQIQKDRILYDINLAKSKSDIVVVSLHWGEENVFYPSPEQIAFARSLIGGGAMIILGHHPHVFQGIERYKGGLIAYSLGNFQFDYDHEGVAFERLKNTLILDIDITKTGIEGYNIIPVRISSNYVPFVVEGEERKRHLQMMSKISRAISDGLITKKMWFEEIGYEYLRGNMNSWLIRIKRYGLKHMLLCIRWLLRPFVVRCYLGVISKYLKQIF